MANTTNFGWETPDDTDLVKDGAAAIRTLGSAIDTSLVDLKGGTTGQILSKTSNTDMDFTWITNDVGDITAVTAGTGITGGGTTGAVTITNDMATTITAAGDIVVGTGNATYDNLPIGTTGQVLTADTTVSPYKVKWATPAGGKLLQLVQMTSTTATTTTSGTYVDSNLTQSITPTSATSKVLVVATIAARALRTTSTDARVQYNIVRTSTQLAENTFEITVDTSATENTVSHSGVVTFYFLDSPATTSATTYKVQYLAVNSATASVCFDSKISTLTLMEIGA